MISRVRIVGSVVLLLIPPVSRADPATPSLPTWGITVKADAFNRLAAPGLKVWPVDRLQFEGFYFGMTSDYDGYALRGLYLLPWGPEAQGRLRPYLGLGYADIRQSVNLGAAMVSLRRNNREAGFTTSADVTARGAGIQLAAGIQLTPYPKCPHIQVEMEVAYATFDIKGRGTIRAEGVGLLEQQQTAATVNVKSDYDVVSLILAVSCYF